MTPALTQFPAHMAARADFTSKPWRSAPDLTSPVCHPVAVLTGSQPSSVSPASTGPNITQILCLGIPSLFTALAPHLQLFALLQHLV